MVNSHTGDEGCKFEGGGEMMQILEGSADVVWHGRTV
jgi:hypothetical protein